MIRFFTILLAAAALADRPNIVLMMTDDQGWGQMGYYDHPALKTPNLDAMAANGLRFDRFYAGSAVCSPTRASVLTGRTPFRTGVPSHGYALRRQEKSLAVALREAGYATAHFGKWHLNGLRGAGAPVLKDDSHSPGVFGFQEWITVTNFYEIDPIMGHHSGEFVTPKGDSSEVIVDQALDFIGKQVKAGKPFFTVLWDGSPHSPWVASEADRAPFADLDMKSQHHYGELVAVDRSVGVLRKGLRDLGVANNTLFWFCSDNGGLNGFKPDTVGGLRGYKGSLYEGGLRVPGIVEWPDGIRERVTTHPAGTIDMFPTIADIVGLPESSMLPMVDGVSLKPLFAGEIGPRKSPLGFRFGSGGAWVDNDYKLVFMRGKYALYNLVEDKAESNDLAPSEPERFASMKAAYEAWSKSVDDSIEGKDYPEGKYISQEPVRGFWTDDPRYAQYKDRLAAIPQLASWAQRIGKSKSGKREPEKKKKKNKKK